MYSSDLVAHFQKEGWTCDDCKTCIVCSESQTNEDLIICEYCDQGVHYSCLSPPPEKRPKVWDCDDCLIARGKPPNNNVKKRSNVHHVTGIHPPTLAPENETHSSSKFSDDNMPHLHPRDKAATTTDTMDSSDSSSDTRSDSDEGNLSSTIPQPPNLGGPPKLSAETNANHSAANSGTASPTMANNDKKFFKLFKSKNNRVDSPTPSAPSPGLPPRAARSGVVSYSSYNSDSDEDESLASKRNKRLIENNSLKRTRGSKLKNKKAANANDTTTATEDEEMDVDINNHETTTNSNKSKSVIQDSPTKNNSDDKDPFKFDHTKQSENKEPKGLVDSLSKYFTPGVKRTSRTALKTSPDVADGNNSSNPRKRKHQFSSSGDEAATNNDGGFSMKKKSRRIKSLDTTTDKSILSDGEDANDKQSPMAISGGRRRHTSSGQSQVRSLYDGLSHLYTDCDSRLRHADQKRRSGDGNDQGKDDGGARSPVPLATTDLPGSGRIQKSSSSRMGSPNRGRDESPGGGIGSFTALAAQELGLMPLGPSDSGTSSKSSKKDKKKRNQSLPAGVNERDLELFAISQEAAKKFLERENSRKPASDITNTTTKVEKEPTNVVNNSTTDKSAPSSSAVPNSNTPNHGVPSQVNDICLVRFQDFFNFFCFL